MSHSWTELGVMSACGRAMCAASGPLRAPTPSPGPFDVLEASVSRNAWVKRRHGALRLAHPHSGARRAGAGTSPRPLLGPGVGRGRGRWSGRGEGDRCHGRGRSRDTAEGPQLFEQLHALVRPRKSGRAPRVAGWGCPGGTPGRGLATGCGLNRAGPVTGSATGARRCHRRRRVRRTRPRRHSGCAGRGQRRCRP